MLIWAQICCLNLSSAQSSASHEFRGFLIDMSNLTVAQRRALTPSYLEQIEVIESAGLPVEILSFMKTIPILADPDFSAVGTHALYRRAKASTNSKGQVVTDLTPMEAKRPILLHEMLHAYDANQWNYSNPTVMAAYERATHEKLYSANALKSHFLANAREYFAISGTIYLVGRIQQEPFTCDILAQKQRKYLEFLEQLFGKHAHCG